MAANTTTAKLKLAPCGRYDLRFRDADEQRLVVNAARKAHMSINSFIVRAAVLAAMRQSRDRA